MTPELWVAIISQTIVILIAIVAGLRHTEKRITKLETKVEHLERSVDPLPGISRAVARLEGRHLVK
jgi:tetrahydromethanopterin S-methyltransferase subunit B